MRLPSATGFAPAPAGGAGRGGGRGIAQAAASIAFSNDNCHGAEMTNRLPPNPRRQRLAREAPLGTGRAETRRVRSGEDSIMQMDKGVLSNYVNVNGIRTHFVEAGQGDPIILVHGAGPGAFGWAGWRQAFPALSPHYHVYAIDTLGFGYTDKPAHMTYSDQDSVDHLGGFIDALCLDKVNLLGNSRGAYMCAKYTCDHPDRVNRLLMVSSGSIAAAMGIEREEKQKDGLKQLQGYDGTPEAMRKFMMKIVHDHSKITDELVELRVKMAALPGFDHVQKMQKKYRDSLAGNPNERQRFELKHRLPALTIPMHMVWGAKDSFAPPEFADRLRALLPNVSFDMLPNSGHQAQNDESDKFNEIALAFFRGQMDRKSAAA
jgi:pimeloyl-ACP methyl ester carboxylesterase